MHGRRTSMAATLCAIAMCAVAPAYPEEARDQEPAPQTAAELRAQLIEIAATGKLDDELLAAFKMYSAARAKESLGSAVSDEFLQWAESNKAINYALLVGLYPRYNVDVVKNMEQLREEFGEKVDSHPHLALAFAFVWGSARGRSVREPLMGYISKQREMPSMSESFDYYLRYERKMKFSLKKTPWPLLVYIVDNDAPIDEREWALRKYQKCSLNDLRGIYYEVPYDNSRVNGPGRMGDKPWTLMNILAYGGVCCDRAYYSTRVTKSIGVPSMYDSGEGGRGGHAWAAWIVRKRNQLDMAFSGRFTYDRYYTGQIYSPLERRKVLDREAQLMAAAVRRTYAGYLEALIGCYAYELLGNDARKTASDLLKAAVRRNPLCARPWRVLAQACVDGTLPQKEGESMYTFMLKNFADYPDLTHEVLGKIMSVRLKVEGEVDDKEAIRNLRILENTFRVYDKAKRPDLAVKLRCLQGRYLEAIGREDSARKLYVAASRKYATEHYGIIELFNRSLAMMAGEEFAEKRMAYLKSMANAVPKFKSRFNEEFNLVNPVYTHVVKSYVAALREAGRADEADEWQKR